MFLCRFNRHTVHQVNLFREVDIEKQASYIFRLQGRRKKSSSIQAGTKVVKKMVVTGEDRIKPALQKHSVTGDGGLGGELEVRNVTQEYVITQVKYSTQTFSSMNSELFLKKKNSQGSSSANKNMNQNKKLRNGATLMKRFMVNLNPFKYRNKIKQCGYSGCRTA